MCSVYKTKHGTRNLRAEASPQAHCLCPLYTISLLATSTWHINVLALLWLVAHHLNASDRRTDSTVTVTVSCGQGLVTVWRRPGSLPTQIHTHHRVGSQWWMELHRRWQDIWHKFTVVTTTTTQCKLQNKCSFVCVHISKYLLGRGKHYQRKLQILPTASVSEVFALIDGRKKHHQRCRGTRPSWALVGAGCSNQMQVAQGKGPVRVCALEQAVIVLQLALCGGGGVVYRW